MKQQSLIFLCFLLISLWVSGQSHFEKGQNFFAQRADKANGLVAKKRFINRAIRHLSKADEPDATALLLRAYEFKGTFTSLSNQRKEKIFKEAVEIGKKSIESNPNHVGIKYYYAVNLGRWGQSISMIKAHKEGITDEMRNVLKEVDQQDSTFAEAGAKRLLGGMHLKIPKVPLVLTWPSKEKALQLLRLAYETTEKNPTNVKLYAEALKEKGDETEAINLFKEVSQRKPRSEMYLEDKRAIEEANRLLKNI
ncbi:tetratricopeptide repeat protein [Ekhidna sp.]|uniref:tetratricopeptide repeat protein n=1 Tax=Ekhidna sp. TaxID=2608089 RepID=UPI003B5A4731